MKRAALPCRDPSRMHHVQITSLQTSPWHQDPPSIGSKSKQHSSSSHTIAPFQHHHHTIRGERKSNQMQLCCLTEQHQKTFDRLLTSPPRDKRRMQAHVEQKKKRATKYQHHRFPCRVCTSHFCAGLERERKAALSSKTAWVKGERPQRKALAKKIRLSILVFFSAMTQIRHANLHNVSKSNKSNQLLSKALYVGPWGLPLNISRIRPFCATPVSSPQPSFLAMTRSALQRSTSLKIYAETHGISLFALASSQLNKIKGRHFGQATAKHLQPNHACTDDVWWK